MNIHYSHALHTHVAADEFGVVLAVYDPATHGTLTDFCATCRELVEG